MESNKKPMQSKANKTIASQKKRTAPEDLRDYRNVVLKNSWDFPKPDGNDKLDPKTREENHFNTTVDGIVENRYTVFLHNLIWLQERSNKNQRQFCEEELQGALKTGAFSEFKKKKNELSYSTMVEISERCGYTIEQMLSTLLDEENREPSDKRNEEEIQKYCGTYDMAFFDTSKAIGNNNRTTESALAQGVMTMFRGYSADGQPIIRVSAFINCTDDESAQLKNLISQKQAEDPTASIPAVYEQAAKSFFSPTGAAKDKYYYLGDMDISSQMARITLHQMYGHDTAEIMFHNRAAASSDKKPYIGGLATMQSISRGEQHMPCVQALIFSKNGFDMTSKEELSEKLYLFSPQIDFSESVDSVVSYMRMLYGLDGGNNTACELSDEDKLYCIKSFAEKKMLDNVRRNLISYYKVSIEMDDNVYRLLKHLNRDVR